MNHNKSHLPYCLARIHVRFSAILFKKLVLLDFDQLYERNVRHHDLEVEAVSTIVSVLSKEIQKKGLKTFQQIRDYADSKHQQQKESKSNANSLRVPLASFNSQDISPIKASQQQTDRTKFGLFTNRTQQSQKLVTMLNKVKKVNDRSYNCKNSRIDDTYASEKVSFFNNNSNLDRTVEGVKYSSRPLYNNNAKTEFSQEQSWRNGGKFGRKMGGPQTMTVKSSKRKQILDKFTQLQQALDVIHPSQMHHSQVPEHDLVRRFKHISRRVQLSAHNPLKL